MELAVAVPYQWRPCVWASLLSPPGPRQRCLRQGQDGWGRVAQGDLGKGVGLEVADPRTPRLSAQEWEPMALDPKSAD